MATKADVINFITPFGILRYPKISEPDTKGEYADNKYKTDMVFSDADYALVEAAAKDAAAKLLPDVKNPKTPLQSWDEGKGIRLKSQYRPAVFDAQNNQLSAKTLIGGGTEARIAIAFFAYKKGGNTGISARLGKVQVKKLVEYTGAGESPFDATEGFVTEAPAAGAKADDSFDSL